MSILFPIIMAFSCFSAIPMPYIEWDEGHMRYMMAAFPLVGAAIGACVLLWGQSCDALGCGQVLRGAGLTVLPILVSGGIHMDGLADVVDAQSSHASPERKREILKDPHVGAFAIMGVGCYLLAFFGLACEVEAHQTTALACVFVLSRCMSGFATVSFRRSTEEGMLALEARAAATRRVRALLVAQFALASAALAAQGIGACVACVATGTVTLAAVRHMANRDFGGMSGDLAGFFLQMAELVMLASIVITGRLV